MSRLTATEYSDSKIVTRAAVDRALQYFHSIRTPSNNAEIQRKMNAMIDVGGLMLFRHRESLLLTALNDEQRATLKEYQAAVSAPPARDDVPSRHDVDTDGDDTGSPAFH